MNLFKFNGMKQLSAIGQSKLHPFLQNNVITSLECRGLDEYDPHTRDNLHNIKRAINTILSIERNKSDWNDIEFLSNLANLIGRHGKLNIL